MKSIKLLLSAFLVLAVTYVYAQKAVLPPEIQIKTALLAVPSDKQNGATVLGYNKNGELVQLRKGTNELICLADDPEKNGVSVACYHKDLEPFMARGRELRKAGKNTKEIFDIREQEVKSGKLKMPEHPSVLYVLSAAADKYNNQTGEVKDSYLRYVVYIPYATSESTGLPLKPEGEAMPWIMYPGTHGAHIMITPSPEKE